MVIFETVFQQQRRSRGRHFPPWGDVTTRGRTRQGFDQVDGFDQHVLFLRGRHRHRVFVQIAMRADLVTVLDDHLHLARKCLNRMSGDEKAGFQPVVLEHTQQSRHADLGRENAALDVGRAVAAAIRPDPACDGIDVGAKGAHDFLGHLILGAGCFRRTSVWAKPQAAATPSMTGTLCSADKAAARSAIPAQPRTMAVA